MVFVFLSDLFYLYLACTCLTLFVPRRGFRTVGARLAGRRGPRYFTKDVEFLAAGGAFTRTESRPVRDRGPWLPGNGRLAAALVPACYLAAALIITWRLWADPASRFVAPNVGDADLFAWYLRDAASAVSHGNLPALVTSGMNAPVGVNLMWNTSLLLPGVLLSPVTLLFGPQVSLTVLTTAGFAGSATAMFFVLRRWLVSVKSSALAGAVYGFSPALVHSAIGHYNLQLAVLPPLIVDAGVRLATGRRRQRDSEQTEAADDELADAHAADEHRADGHRADGLETGDADASVGGAGPGGAGWAAAIRTGAWLGLLAAAQLFISEELLLITVLAGSLFVAALALFNPGAVARRVLPVLAGVAVAAVVTLALAGHALWVQFHGPLVQHGPLYPLDYYVNEFSGFVTPSSFLYFHTAGSAATAAGYHAGLTEYLAYLGWPLIIVLAAAAVAGWRRPAARAAAFTLVVLAVFSFGGHPQTRGVPDPSLSLPWHWLEEHQLLSSVLPDRLSILIDGAAAVLLAFGLDAVTVRAGTVRAGSVRDGTLQAGTPGAGTRRQRSLASVAVSVAVLACLPLLPRPLPAASATPLPRGWSAALTALHLPAGARVLVVPVPTNILTPAMRWQADSGSPTSLVGGYFIGPGAGGQAYIGGTGVSPTSWYLDRLWAAGLPRTSPFVRAAGAAGLPIAGPRGPAPVDQAPAPSQVRTDLASWRPAAVVAVTAAGSPLAKYLVMLLGPPLVHAGTVIAWRR